jgi:hypothetical protein
MSFSLSSNLEKIFRVSDFVAVDSPLNALHSLLEFGTDLPLEIAEKKAQM